MIINKTSIKRDTDLLIETWDKETALWNVNSDDYKNKDLKATSLKKLVGQFNISGIYFSFFVCSSALDKIYTNNDKFFIFLEGV